MRFHAEEGTDSLVVGGQTYTVNEHGHFEVENHEHHGLLRQLGCRGENDEVKVEVVVAAEPPALPEGYDEETLRALIEECEDQKVAIERLNGENGKLIEANATLAEALSEANAKVEELNGLLEEATNALQSATEGASGAVDGATGAESTTDTGAATEEAPPATGKAKAK